MFIFIFFFFWFSSDGRHAREEHLDLVRGPRDPPIGRVPRPNPHRHPFLDPGVRINLLRDAFLHLISIVENGEISKGAATRGGKGGEWGDKERVRAFNDELDVDGRPRGLLGPGVVAPDVPDLCDFRIAGEGLPPLLGHGQVAKDTEPLHIEVPRRRDIARNEHEPDG